MWTCYFINIYCAYALCWIACFSEFGYFQPTKRFHTWPPFSQRTKLGQKRLGNGRVVYAVGSMLDLFMHFPVNWNLWQPLLIFPFPLPFPLVGFGFWPCHAHTHRTAVEPSTCLGQICVADLFVYGQQIARSLLLLLLALSIHTFGRSVALAFIHSFIHSQIDLPSQARS